MGSSSRTCSSSAPLQWTAPDGCAGARNQARNMVCGNNACAPKMRSHAIRGLLARPSGSVGVADSLHMGIPLRACNIASGGGGAPNSISYAMCGNALRGSCGRRSNGRADVRRSGCFGGRADAWARLSRAARTRRPPPLLTTLLIPSIHDDIGQCVSKSELLARLWTSGGADCTRTLCCRRSGKSRSRRLSTDIRRVWSRSFSPFANGWGRQDACQDKVRDRKLVKRSERPA